MIELLIHRVTYQYVDGECLPKDNSEEIAKYSEGDKYTVHVAAPGYGKVVYKITKIDERGVWGKKEMDNSGILSKWDVI